MSNTAFQIHFRDMYVAGFEQHKSLISQTVTNEAMIKGQQATFLVADSGGATAVTRGVNGLIPRRADNLNQFTATLQEWHDLPAKTNFNIFASQSDQKAIMSMTSSAVINRKVDQDILGELNTATNDTGPTQTASLRLSLYAKTILGNNQVPFDGQISALITPAYEAFLMQTTEFGSADYITRKPTENADLAWSDQMQMFRWLGVNWIVHPQLPGFGTANAKCFMYHKSSIGHAVDTAGLQSLVGYNEEQDYSWARCTVYMGSKLLQNSGVVVINHDDSQFIAQ